MAPWLPTAPPPGPRQPASWPSLIRVSQTSKPFAYTKNGFLRGPFFVLSRGGSPRFSHPPRGVRNPLLRLWLAQLPQLPKGGLLAGGGHRHLGDDRHRPGYLLRQLPGTPAWKGVHGDPAEKSMKKGSPTQSVGGPFQNQEGRSSALRIAGFFPMVHERW